MSADTREAIYSLNISSSGQVVNFYDMNELVRFISEQAKAYSWMSNLKNSHFGNNLQQIVYGPLIKANSLIQQSEDIANPPHQVIGLLRSAFSDQPLPLAGSADHLFLIDIHDSRGATTAGAALAFMLGKLDQLALNSKEIWSGLFLASNREQGIGKTSSTSAKAAFEKLSARLASELEELERSNAKFYNDHRRSLSVTDRRASVLLRWQSRGFKNALKEARHRNDAAINELAAVRKTYEEMMKLKAPVDYWRDKAKNHREAAENYKGVLVKHGRWIGPSILLILLAIAAVGYYVADPSKPVIAQFVFAAVGILVTTVAFWAARIVVRLYMSEHHLAIDAEERATMAMTYLALTERGAAEEKDRALVLASLFRPTSDGIVKDDAAPDFSPAAIASKYLTR